MGSTRRPDYQEKPDARGYRSTLHFRMLTSELSLRKIFDEHERIDRGSLDSLFEGLQNATPSNELKQELARLVRDREE